MDLQQTFRTLTATEVNAIDAAALTFATLSSGSGLVRVPFAVALYKPAGTAYTVGGGTRLEIKDDDGNVLFSVAAEGFLDQATAQSRFQLFDSGAFAAANYTFSISATGSLSAGTSTLGVRVFFFEFPLAW